MKISIADENTFLRPSYYDLPKNSGKPFLIHYYTGSPTLLYHYHPEYELVLTRGGYGKRIVGDTIDTYEKLDLILLGPGIPHTFVYEGFFYEEVYHDNIVFHFTIESLGKGICDRDFFYKIQNFLKDAMRGYSFHSVFSQQVEKYMLDIMNCTDEVERFSLFLILLSRLEKCKDRNFILYENYIPGNTLPDQERFNKILNYINEKHTEIIRLEDAAQAAFMTVPTFTRFFRRTTGKSFIKYLNEWKLKKASTLLLNTDFKIIDVCYLAGFQNLSYFNRQFVSYYKKTPAQYRRSVCLKDKIIEPLNT